MTDGLKERVESIIPRRHLGRFRLRADLVRENPLGTLQLLGHALVVQAVFDPVDGCFAYVAYSEYFDPVSVGETAPEYLALFSGGGSGKGRFLGFTRKGRIGDERRVRSGDVAAAGAEEEPGKDW